MRIVRTAITGPAGEEGGTAASGAIGDRRSIDPDALGYWLARGWKVDANDDGVADDTGPAGAYLPVAGGTLTGDLAMGTHKITGLGDPTTAQDAATQAYVLAVRDALVNGAPGTLDTLNEIAAQLGSDESTAAALATTVAAKLAKASNLSDLASAATARTNLGLAAVAATGAYSDLSGRPNIPATLFFNVKDSAYGALGDSNGTTGNGTDDTTAINAAITACVAAGGGTVFFPAGIYRITAAAISITSSNVSILGAGRSAKLFFDTLDNSSYGGLMFDGGASSGTISGNSARNLTIFNRTGATNTAGLGNQGWDGVGCRLTIRGCEKFTVDNVEVYQAPNYGIVTIRSTDGSIFNCDTHDNLADGVHIHSGSKRITVANCHIRDVLDDGIAINAGATTWGACEDIAIVGNTIYNAGNRGISIMSPANDVTVVGNTVYNTTAAGINVSVDVLFAFGAGSINHVTITGNVVRDAGLASITGARGSNTGACGIYLKPGNGYDITDVVITGNQIVNPRNGWVWVEGTTSNVFVHQLVVTGNTFRGIGNIDTLDSHNPGIRLRSCINPKVADNHGYGSWHEAVLADSRNGGIVRLADNVFSRCNLSPATAATKYGWTVSAGLPAVSGNLLVRSIVAGAESLTSATLDVNNSAVEPGSAAGGLVLASDTMTKANGALAGTSGQVGPAWAAMGSGHTISSNKAVATYVAGGLQYYTVVDSSQADDYIEAQMTLSATPTRLNSGVVLRAVDVNNVIKAVIYYSGSAFTYYLAARFGGVDNTLATGSLSGGLAATMTASSTHTIAALVSNGTVYMLLDGTLVAAGNLQSAWASLWTATKTGIATFTGTSGDDGTVAFTTFKTTN